MQSISAASKTFSSGRIHRELYSATDEASGRERYRRCDNSYHDFTIIVIDAFEARDHFSTSSAGCLPPLVHSLPDTHRAHLRCKHRSACCHDQRKPSRPYRPLWTPDCCRFQHLRRHLRTPRRSYQCFLLLCSQNASEPTVMAPENNRRLPPLRRTTHRLLYIITSVVLLLCLLGHQPLPRSLRAAQSFWLDVGRHYHLLRLPHSHLVHLRTSASTPARKVS